MLFADHMKPEIRPYVREATNHPNDESYNVKNKWKENWPSWTSIRGLVFNLFARRDDANLIARSKIDALSKGQEAWGESDDSYQWFKIIDKSSEFLSEDYDVNEKCSQNKAGFRRHFRKNYIHGSCLRLEVATALSEGCGLTGLL